MYGYETFHEDLMKNLIESVHNGASSHAYIFEGEKGLGVLNSARLFAAALTCKNTGVTPMLLSWRRMSPIFPVSLLAPSLTNISPDSKCTPREA